MKHLFTLLLNFTLLTAFTQTPGWQWVQHGGGDGYPGSTSSNPGSDIVSTSAVDKEGNLIVGGYCSWYPEFDTISFPTVGGVTNWDFQTFFVAKYNSHGDVLWVNVAGGITDDRALALDVDESGNIYVFGTIVASGTGTAHIIAQNTDTIISSTIYSFIKFDKNGNLLHLKNYNPPISNFWGVKAGMFRRLSSGNFVSLVQVNTTGGLANIDGYMAPDNSNNLVFFDTLGNVIQGKVIDTLSHLSNAVNSMVLDDMDNIYMSYLNYNSTQVTLLGTVINPAPTLSVYLLKTNASLNLVDINTSGANCGALAFLTCDGKYLYASDRNPLGASFDGDTANINLQYTIYKIDTNLNRVWTSKSDLQSIPPNWTYMKSVGTNNYVYSAFQNRGTVTWDTVSVITPANNAHMVMLKFDAANGTCLGSYKTSGTIPLNGNQFTDVKTDPQGNVYLFGNFTNSIGVPGDSVYSLGGANSPDYFILKWGLSCTDTVPTVVCSSSITRTNTDSLYSFNANATGTGTLTYDWSNNGTAFSTAASPELVLENVGSYAICVTVTDANNCTTTACDTVTITVFTCSTVISYTTTDTTYNFSTVNTGTPGFTYEWTNNGQAISSAAAPALQLSAGSNNVCVSVTDANNCKSTDCENIIISSVANGYQRLNNIVFPNPATTQAQLLFTVNHDQSAEFTVTDSKGSLVSRRTIQFRAGKNLYNFRTADWASGVYLITIQNQELKWSSRLVKE
ncbi:MAG: T9SS type A sorting domain-containing protein [Chitinophagales bacterium]